MSKRLTRFCYREKLLRGVTIVKITGKLLTERFSAMKSWCKRIIGIIAAMSFIVVVVGFCISEYRAYEKYKQKISDLSVSLDNADKFCESNMPEEALNIYKEALKEISSKKEPEI